MHSCQPAEFVITNGGGFGRAACPLKLKKMAHCSTCDVKQNKRMCANVDCSRRMYRVVYGTQGKKEKKKKVGFSLFGNKVNHSEIRILILIS